MTQRLTQGNQEKQQQAEDDPKGQSTAADMLWVCPLQTVGKASLKKTVDSSTNENHEGSNEMYSNHIDVLHTIGAQGHVETIN